MSGFVETKSSRNKSNAERLFESVTFVSQKRNDKPTKSNQTTPVPTKLENRQTDLKKLRYEVIKLGTSGMDPTKKEASSLALAVALGAKPPKNKPKNYKEILALKREQKKKLDAGMKSVDYDLLKQSTRRHLYVIGNKVIPAKPKSKDGVKNFLESYGKPGHAKFGKGFKRKSSMR